VSDNVTFAFASHMALADQVPLTVVAEGTELVIIAFALEVFPVISAPPPTRTAPPVHDAVAGPKLVPTFWFVLMTAVPVTLVTVAVPLGPVVPVGP
jgi:hypothetical protein